MLRLRYGIPYAVLFVVFALPCAGAKKGAQPGIYDLEKAQAMVDFVVYVPRYLPAGCRVSSAIVVPEEREGVATRPGQIYMPLGERLALWQMEQSPALIPSRIEGVTRLGSVRAWIVGRSTGGYRTITWVRTGTQFGLTGKYEVAELLRAAESMTPAAPHIAPRQLREDRLPSGGIGAVLWLYGEHFVDEVAEGSPAEAAGVRPGDEILAVDGRSVRGLAPPQIVRLVRGEVGKKVAITLRRDGRVFTRALVRAPVPSVVSVRQPLDEAVKSMPFPVLMPKWMPDDFHLSEVAVSTLQPDTRREGPHLELVFARTRSDLMHAGAIFVTEKTATSGGALPARRFARIGAASAAVYTTQTGEISLRWIAGSTQVTVHSNGVAFKELIKAAASMR